MTKDQRWQKMEDELATLGQEFMAKLSRKYSCAGCKYDNHTTGLKYPCVHPLSNKAGFWNDTNDYSCYKPL